MLASRTNPKLDKLFPSIGNGFLAGNVGCAKTEVLLLPLLLLLLLRVLLLLLRVLRVLLLLLRVLRVLLRVLLPQPPTPLLLTALARPSVLYQPSAHTVSDHLLAVT